MRYLNAGESHGRCLVGIIEGLPAGLRLTAAEIDRHLARRQRGYGRGGRMAIENDRVEFLSGLRFNETLGSPLALKIANRDWPNWQRLMDPEGERPPEAEWLTCPRPGHADLAGGAKYFQHDLRNVLERASARETAMRVAVGSVARRLLEHFGFVVYSHVLSIGDVRSGCSIAELLSAWDHVESSPLRCADPEAGAAMIGAIEQAGQDGDTLGGVFEILVTGVPVGLGSYVHWDRRLDGRLAGALMSIQGIKGVELGAGFAGASVPGSALHDPICCRPGQGIYRPTNSSGGLEGGVTNGQPLVIRAAMKPIPTLARPLPSVDLRTGEASPGAVERSDICAVPAASVVAEAVVCWELAVAFREKFAGDHLSEAEAAVHYYRQQVKDYCRQD